MWQARRTKLVMDYTDGKEKMAKIIKHIHVYRDAELSTYHYLLSTRLTFPPRWENKQNLKGQGNTLQESSKVCLLNDIIIQWLHKNRMDDYLEYYKENTDFEHE
jgi:hypothetical protein